MRHIEELIEILCGFIVDVQSSIRLIEDMEEHETHGENAVFRQGAYRVCLNSIFLNLAKFIEFHDKYNRELHSLFPELTDRRKYWVSEFKKRDVIGFRNKFVAHIRCKASKKPLTYDEMDSYVSKICGGRDALAFFEWLYPEIMIMVLCST